MFASLESGKDESELQNGGLSLKRNPLVVSIIDGCDTLKALAVKSKITAEMISGAKGFILMRTDKVMNCSSRQTSQILASAWDMGGGLLTLLMLSMQIGFGISVTQGYGLVVTRQHSTPSGW